MLESRANALVDVVASVFEFVLVDDVVDRDGRTVASDDERRGFANGAIDEVALRRAAIGSEFTCALEACVDAVVSGLEIVSAFGDTPERAFPARRNR